MIFVTVGTELPFDRMISIIDDWAEKSGRTDVFAQIGKGGRPPRFLQYAKFLEPDEFKRRFNEAKVVIAHAGMGSILSALHHGKPIIIMPRKAALGEQRNDHQMATAKHLLDLGKVSVGFDEEELREHLDNLNSLEASVQIGQYAGEGLIKGLQNFLSKGA